MKLKKKILHFIRKLTGTGYITPDDIRHRGGELVKDVQSIQVK